MKPGDPGYKWRLGWFRKFHCHRYRNIEVRHCPYLVRTTDILEDPVECPHQPGWYCISPKNPGNIKLEDLVVEAL